MSRPADARPPYDDGGIACDDTGVTIRRYYAWGAKHVPYSAIRGVSELPLRGVSQLHRWRFWASGEGLHWWNTDRKRADKDVALVLDVGRRVRPTITPVDPTAVKRIICEHIPG